jgi:hypothetical protein
MGAANLKLDGLLIELLAKEDNLSASQLSTLAQKAGLLVTKTEVNSSLYKLQLRGAVRCTTLDGGKKPRWSIAAVSDKSDPLADRLYRLVVANPGKRVNLAEFVANLLEEFKHPKAAVVRRIADATNKK